MKTGILALQGSFHEHASSLNLINKEFVFIKTPKDLNNVDSLILPGGESTAMLKIQENNTLFLNLKKIIETGIPTLGTCAGLIILSNQDVLGKSTLGVIDCTVERNGYGRQNQSFEGLVKFENFISEYCFIRAPIIKSYGTNVNPIAFLDDQIVGVQYNNIVGLTFHPELSNDINYLSWLDAFLKEESNVGTF